MGHHNLFKVNIKPALLNRNSKGGSRKSRHVLARCLMLPYLFPTLTCKSRVYFTHTPFWWLHFPPDPLQVFIDILMISLHLSCPLLTATDGWYTFINCFKYSYLIFNCSHPIIIFRNPLTGRRFVIQNNVGKPNQILNWITQRWLTRPSARNPNPNSADMLKSTQVCSPSPTC